ncbi:MAG: hypothetical protein ACXVA9_05240 [Bdellovibrionales bacterium]
MNAAFAISSLSLAVVLTIHAEQMPRGKTVSSAYNEAKKQTGAELLTELVFEKGSSDLSGDARSQLRDIIHEAQKKGKIADVLVISWADKEYPFADRKMLGRDERKLADDRLLEIKNYIADNSDPASVQTFNMAEQPDALEKLIKTSPNLKIKQSLESAGLAHPYQTGMPPKASHALVMVSLH